MTRDEVDLVDGLLAHWPSEPSGVQLVDSDPADGPRDA
jgi:hypothetical protein